MLNMAITKGLIESLKRGDRKAAHELYTQTVSHLHTLCHRYITDEEDVRDVMQEAYIKVFRNIADYREQADATLLSWMKRIFINEALMFLRSKHRDLFIMNGDELPDQEDELEVTRFTPDELHQAIRQLPTGCRTVLNLYVFEEKTHREIAQILGIRENSSASQLSRAKQQLKRLLLMQEGDRQ